MAGGGNLKVPCLRIVDEQGDVRRMYEFGEIIGYLEGRFTGASAGTAWIFHIGAPGHHSPIPTTAVSTKATLSKGLLYFFVGYSPEWTIWSTFSIECWI